MMCELSKQETQHIEKYRDLRPEFQKALDREMKVLFELQTTLMKETLKSLEK